MTENQKPKHFSLVKLVRDIWAIHVAIASLLYPRPFLPTDKDGSRELPYLIISLIGGTLLLCANLIVLVVLLTRPPWGAAIQAFLVLWYAHSSWMGAAKAFLVVLITQTSWIDLAKVFFVFYTWLLIGVVFIVFNHLSDIYDLFLILEKAAIQSRDESAMMIRAGEASLETWERKFTAAPTTELSFSSFFQKAAPLILLFFRKEKNMLHIGVEAFKLVFANTHLLKKLF